MLLGTTIQTSWDFPIRGQVMNRYRLGDLQERQVEADERRQTRAMEFLISERQTARQENVQKMALEAAQKAADASSAAQLSLLITSQESQRQLVNGLLVFGIAGFALYGVMKWRAAGKEQPNVR